jgi:hypothetical protein
VQFQKKKGHCRVPATINKEYQPLGEWMFKQRLYFSRENMAPDKIAKFQTLGVTFSDLERKKPPLKDKLEEWERVCSNIHKRKSRTTLRLKEAQTNLGVAKARSDAQPSVQTMEDFRSAEVALWWRPGQSLTGSSRTCPSTRQSNHSLGCDQFLSKTRGIPFLGPIKLL